MSIKQCPTCQARWVDDQLYWSTNKPGKNEDLAGLVCNTLSGNRPCINPCKGDVTGDTWENRRKFLDRFTSEL